jgi:hypothetical protein
MGSWGIAVWGNGNGKTGYNNIREANPTNKQGVRLPAHNVLLMVPCVLLARTPHAPPL